MVAKSDIGQRGKAAEKAVEQVLKKWNGKANFAYFRLADSRAARGMIAAQPGDFSWFCGGRGGILEVKESQHPYRIAKDKVSQLPTLHKLQLAGASNLILVHHSTEKVWRAVPAEALPFGVPSWDLSGFKTFPTPEEAMLSTGWF